MTEYKRRYRAKKKSTDWGRGPSAEVDAKVMRWLREERLTREAKGGEVSGNG